MNKGKCPICGGKVVVKCKCPCAQSTCENGCVWHYCQAHEIPRVVVGERDHGAEISKCSCFDEHYDGFGWLQ